MNIFRYCEGMCVAGKFLAVSMSAQEDTMLLVMLLQTTESRIIQSIKMKKHLFANAAGLELEITPGTSVPFSTNGLTARKSLDVCQDNQIELCSC